MGVSGISLSALGALVRGPGAASRPMHRELRLVNASWLVLIAAVGLSLLGVYMIDVAESVQGEATATLAPIAWKQVVFMLIGMIAAAVVALPHYRFLNLFAWPAMILMVALLVFLLLPFVPSSLVTARNGSRGWINLGVVDFQPSEIAKLTYVMVVAGYMRYRTAHRHLTGLVVPGILTAVPIGLIMLQPDLGTSLMFVPSLFAMLVAAGARLRHLTLIVLLAALTAPAAYPLLRPHQKARIMGMIHQIEGDPTTAHDINYQSLTAQRLVGAGMATGMPDDKARAVIHYNRLPERHNDMIFALVGARFGLLGGLALLGLYSLWIGGALLVAASCREPLGRLLAVGIAAFIAAQTVVNVGMNIGLFPITGITLPFVSYGGSAMLSTWLMTGLLVNIAIHRPRPPYRESFEYADENEAIDTTWAVRPYGKSAGFSGRALTR